MEVVGTVAAVITLAKDIAAISDSLVRDIRHAPQELIQCCNQIALISLELMYIERLQKADMFKSLLPTDESYQNEVFGIFTIVMGFVRSEICRRYTGSDAEN
jgi:hypothetical protein